MRSTSESLRSHGAAPDEAVVPNRLKNPAYLRGDSTRYLDGVANQLAATKRRLHDLLAPTPGQQVLDVGCGTGNDVLALAERIGPGGQVVGVDTSDKLVTEARSRAVDGLPVTFRTADAAALPFAGGSFHACRSERVLQHVADPAQAIAEMVRVTLPGGRILLADPDHDMWAVDLADRKTTRTLLTWWVDHIRNPWMGRQLPGLLCASGVRDVGIEVLPIVLTELAAADAVVGLSKAAQSAAEAGVVAPDAARAWLDDARTRDAEGRFLMCGALVVALGRTPASHR